MVNAQVPREREGYALLEQDAILARVADLNKVGVK
jgi:hypothetical protein